ncbi:MAG: hypothetical protein ABIV36_06370 [Sphingobium limneticum]
MQMRQERSAILKRLRQARAETLAAVADKMENERIRREFEAAERALDVALRRFWKRVRIQPEPRRHAPAGRKARSVATSTGHSGMVLKVRSQASSGLSRRDRAGREGIMLRIRYVRAGGQHAKPGCVVRHWRYIAREAAVSLDSDGEPIVLSNLGDAHADLDGFIEQVAGGLAVQEKVLRAMRKNAKLSFRMVGAFPYGLPTDARREVLQRIGDQVFGARGLGWSAAAHDADPDAKVDNPHFHLDYSLLPTERQSDGSFVVANELRTDLDGQEGLRFIRHQVARILTEVAQEQGLDRTFTALSYRDRGMDREGGEHVGQQGTASHRSGHHVASIARNDARCRRDDARERAREARSRLEALEQLKRAIERDAAAVPDVVEAPVLMSPPAAAASMDLADMLPLMDVGDVAAPAPVEDLPIAPPLFELTEAQRRIPAEGPPPPIVAIGKEPPRMPVAPVLAGAGRAGPIDPPLPALVAIRAETPVDPSPPAFADVGVAVSIPMPTPVRIVAIGQQPPRMIAPGFDLWDIGKDVASDEDEDRAEADLRRIVQREHLRRQEAAAAKPLDPFGAGAGSHVRTEFEELMALLEKQPGLLAVHEGQIFPGNALPAHLRKVLHGYALHPRARSTILNAANNARNHGSGDGASPKSVAARAAAAQAARNGWQR